MHLLVPLDTIKPVGSYLQAFIKAVKAKGVFKMMRHLPAGVKAKVKRRKAVMK